MIRKAIVTIALAASLAALSAILLPGPSGAAHRKYTFAFVTDGVDPRDAIARGGRTAARNLGVRYILAGTTLEVSKLAREDALFGGGSNRRIARRADGDVVRGASRKLVKSIGVAAQPR